MNHKTKSVVLLSLGSNMGDREGTILSCINELGCIPDTRVVCVSSMVETKAIGSKQPDFINSAVLVETELLPDKLLEHTKSIENKFGRVRTMRWGSRTLDVDIILFGDTRITTQVLTVPHKLFREREFVLSSASEIAPDMVDPVSGYTIKQLLLNLLSSKTKDET